MAGFGKTRTSSKPLQHIKHKVHQHNPFKTEVQARSIFYDSYDEVAPAGDQTDEDYWDSSNASKIGKSKFNLFDDSVDLDVARRILANPGWDKDDDSIVVDWDGTATKQPNRPPDFPKSARYRPPPSSGGQPGVRATRAASIDSSSGRDHFAPHASLQKRASDAGVTDRKMTRMPAMSIDEAMEAPRQPTQTEVAKLQSDIMSLRRQLEQSRNNKFEKISTKATVKNIIHGKPYSLEMYKSKQEKLQLLDDAIALHDGNAIIAVVLFLRGTLKQSLFQSELISREDAVSHFVTYLKQMEDWPALEEVYILLNRSEDAAMMRYQQALMKSAGNARISALMDCQKHFQTRTLTHEGALIEEHISLLQRQLPIDEDDNASQRNGDPKFMEHPKAASIVGYPLLTTLFYCCLYHYHLGENSLASPVAIRAKHKLTEKQFTWTALQARSQRQQWRDIEMLFQTKGLLGRTKMKSIIPFEKVIQVLSKYAAPREIMNKYCRLIPNSDERIEAGAKFECHETVIETLQSQRDRQQLMAYCSKLKPQSQEWFYAQDCLKSNTKWKN